MSNKYKNADEIPDDVLCDRLKALAEFTKDIENNKSEFTMRIPAELDRDADLVLVIASSRIIGLREQVNAAKLEIFKQREQVADFMLKNGFYTMHGDTVASLLDELGRQIVELRAKGDAVMSDGETEADYWHDVKEHRKSLRARLCVSCPGCPKIQPKRDPTILLPQQRCKVCGYRDIRKRED